MERKAEKARLHAVPLDLEKETSSHDYCLITRELLELIADRLPPRMVIFLQMFRELLGKLAKPLKRYVLFGVADKNDVLALRRVDQFVNYKGALS